MKCINCNINKAQLKSPYGYLPCKPCVKRQKRYKAGQTIEITTDAIKEDRNVYSSDIEQRYEGNTPNLNYINKYGTRGFSVDEIKRAKAAHTTYYRDSWERYNPKKAT